MAVNQSYLFLIFTINGLFIGIIFDFFRILRKEFKTSNLVTYIEDIMFWIISGISIIYSMVNFSNGSLRFYMVVGILIGVITYILTIGKYIRMFSVAIIDFFKKIVKYICCIIIYPLKLIHKIIFNSLWKVAKRFYLNVRELIFLDKNIKISDKLLLDNTKNRKKDKKRGIFQKNVEKEIYKS